MVLQISNAGSRLIALTLFRHLVRQFADEYDERLAWSAAIHSNLDKVDREAEFAVAIEGQLGMTTWRRFC